MKPLDLLDDLDHYRNLFTSVAFWTPYVQEVCQRHNLLPGEPVRIGVPGTCPTFIVGEHWVIKFFGRLFEGQTAFLVEREAGRLVALDPAIPAAQWIAQGELSGEGWPWPYLVFSFIPGVSVGELADQISEEDWQSIARELGQMVKRLHALPLQGSAVFPHTLSAYSQLLKTQRATCTANQREWGSLPAHLIEQIEEFLPPLETLVDHSRPVHLIHSDLTRDHLLGRVVDGHWQTLGLIDFGDAMTGDFLYELAALHLDLFRGSRRLLQSFLAAYALSPLERSALPQKAMATALLHQFNVFGGLPPEMMQAKTLAALADMLWGE